MADDYVLHATLFWGYSWNPTSEAKSNSTVNVTPNLLGRGPEHVA
jgi:hypothetical protein